MLWGRIFILDLAYISRKFPTDPRLFSPENEEISTPPPRGFIDWNISILGKLVNRNFQKERVKEVGCLFHLQILSVVEIFALMITTRNVQSQVQYRTNLELALDSPRGAG